MKRVMKLVMLCIVGIVLNIIVDLISSFMAYMSDDFLFFIPSGIFVIVAFFAFTLKKLKSDSALIEKIIAIYLFIFMPVFNAYLFFA